MKKEEQMNTVVEIKHASKDEITGWSRLIQFTFNGKLVKMRLDWTDWDGYDTGRLYFEEEWSDQEKSDLMEYLSDHDNLASLDDHTAYWEEQNNGE
jgi:hypothetical protein